MYALKMEPLSRFTMENVYIKIPLDSTASQNKRTKVQSLGASYCEPTNHSCLQVQLNKRKLKPVLDHQACSEMVLTLWLIPIHALANLELANWGTVLEKNCSKN